MVGRQVHVARLGLHHRERELLGQRGERSNRRRHAPAARGHDQRELGLGDQACGLLDRRARRLRRDRAERTHRVAAGLDRGSGEDLARQGQVDRSARLAHRDVEGAIDHRCDRLAGAQLVVPFHVFAQHAALVEGFLPPMDRPVARGDVASLGDRRAAGGEQDRDVVARGVDDAVDRVGGSHGDVHHHGGRLAGDAVIAVRHRHGDVLVRHGHEPRGLGVLRLRERLHDRGEIGSGIGEHVLDAALSEPRNVGFRRHAVGGLGVGHGHIHSMGRGRAMQGDGPPDVCQ